ncbi:MAG TPA: type VI secretion system tube protein Hcp [Casimicrobiaceae bacterium]|nr:type VI secretion system tube protein Hcp [Casimicrobiaceae bacterium]
MALHLKVSNGVNGESEQGQHKKWIDLESVHWGASQPAAIRGGGVAAGVGQFHDLTCVAKIDCAYPDLLQKCADGTHFDSVELNAVKAGGSNLIYLKICMYEVLVTSVDINGSSGQDVMVSYSFQGAKLTTAYTPQTKTGGAGAAITKTWDIKQQNK